MKWKRAPLADLCAQPDDIRCGPFGTQLNKDEFRNEGVPLWGIKQVNVGFSRLTEEFLEPGTAIRLRQYDLIPGDLVMTRKGTVGNCAVYPAHFEPGIMHSDLLRMRLDRDRCDPAFLVYQLHHSEDVSRQLSLISGGAIMPGINVGKLKQLEVLVPPLAEQKRIAGILDAADALRAKRRESLARLDLLLQSTFLTLFGDPVSNPMGWEVIRLGEKARRITKGQSPKWQGFDYQISGALFVTSENVRSGYLDISTPKFVPLEFNAKLKGSQLCDGDLLINLVGASIGRSCIFSNFSGPANVNQAVAVVTIKDPVLTNYIVQLLQTSSGQTLVTGRIVDAARANVSLANLRELPIPLPPLPLQRRFAAIVESVERQKSRQRAHLAELDALFASLQHRAFRGEL